MYAIVALCLVAFAAAQTPQPCMTPTQWEANVFEINQQRGVQVRARLSYDGVYHRERVIEEVNFGRQDAVFDVIALFDLKVEYVFDLRARNCTRRTLNRPWRDFGIRPDARSYGEAYIGSSAVPGGNILVTLWGGNHTGPANDTVRTFGSWTYQACLPTRLTSHSSQFGRTETSFFDIVAGISNPSVFIPRQECLTEEEYANRETLFGQSPKKI